MKPDVVFVTAWTFVNEIAKRQVEYLKGQCMELQGELRAKQAQAHGQAHRRSGGGADGGATMAALAADESVADASTAESRTGAGA